ncbi:MAG: low temperature requirement protein A [Brevibacterium sp.]|nr:low temperature requirement protein A [Brevibacterium sp.]MDN6133044.1 low temperature requirement protein A [Brevibacterium sp.]MDN6175965.1 low temperature requirement protein A [Brevibacterium sp.]MDN6188995.1 low temperature requirement protein A [Brevibacterium sp.]MDN6192177.1 low temperature requirement protein A [Brevibacterium sp.]
MADEPTLFPARIRPTWHYAEESDVNSAAARSSRFRLEPMRPRDPGENGRAASSLELFFDLVFVIAVSIAATQLHHSVAEGHLGDGLVAYLMIFYAIWWAWMNFTWFGTSFDNDDWLYRVMTVVQMGGVLILAAGIEPAFVDGEFTVVVLGYVLMRIVMIAQWLRASRRAGPARRATIFYACGIGLAQVLWIAWLAIEPQGMALVCFALLALVELSVPVIAEIRGSTPWHPHHITERYGLFTIILLGESLLASANAIFGAFADNGEVIPLVTLGALCLVVTASMWWIYFWPPHHRAVSSIRKTLTYGYGRYFVFAAAGAFSAGVGVEVDSQLSHSEISPLLGAFMISVPITVFVLGVWVLAIRANAGGVVNTVVPVCAVLVLFDPIIPIPTFLTTFFMIVIVITLIVASPKGGGPSLAEAVPEDR